MLARLNTTLNRIRGKQQPMKYTVGYGGASNGLYPLGFYPQDNRDLDWSKVGAAASYCFVPEVANCIDSIVGGIESLAWDVKRYPKGIRRNNRQAIEGTILASDDDLQNRHPFQRAFARFQRDNNMSFIGAIAYDYILYGETAFEIAHNGYGYNTAIEWLNPLGLQIFAQAQIQWFRFGWNTTYVTYQPEEVAYLHNRNPFNDFVGYPPVLSVIDKINIIRNTDRFLRDYYLNNARPGLVVMPTAEMASISPQDHERLKTILREQFKGVGGQYNTLILQQALQFEQLEQPDLVRNSQLTREQVDAIYERFSVPRAMRGNTSATPYKDGDETTRRFYLDAILPLAKIIQEFINAEFMPYFDNDTGLEVFEFDTSPFDMVTEADMQEAQIIDLQLRSGLIDMYTAALMQERPADERLRGMHIIDGLPIHIDELRDYWKKKLLVAPSVYNTPEITGEPLPEPVPADEVIPTESGGQPVSDEYIEDAIEGGTSRDSSSSKAHDHEHSHNSWHSLYDDDPNEDAIDERVKTYLGQWKRYALRRFGTEKSAEIYTTDLALPPYIRYAVIDALDTCKSHDDIKAMFASILEHPHIKTIQTYHRALRELALALWKDDITPSDFRQRMSERIERSLEEAFVDGVKQGGLTRDDLDGNDWNELTKAVREEKTHVANLADWIDANGKANGGKQRDVYARVDRWVVRYENVKDLGYLIAKQDAPQIWRYDPRKEHCRSCKALNGQVRRASFWRKLDVRPKSQKLECFGIYCGCGMEDTDQPVTKGKLPKLWLRE